VAVGPAVLMMQMAVDLGARIDDPIVFRSLAQHDAGRHDERDDEDQQEQPIL
jgi:hypothetical protein